MHIHYDITLAPTSYTRLGARVSIMADRAVVVAAGNAEERLSGAVHLPPPREARMGASVHATLMGEFWVEIYLDLDPPFVEISGCLTPLMVVLLAFLGGSEGLGMWMNRVGVDRIDPGRYLRSCRVAKP